ncbi:MAG TPA: carboxyltransferase domain-containing protein [Pelagibacterium sp.]|uniref:5-oxoprolinase subunit B family protein n=1 Tax=Pelagibacterium sp. TaxID=1967288 RepID=UPI002CA5918D|nr:carboxyltransferase domain-containing protein [Pelagibacterium sp.]HWJ88616.1 carboxyltransferase domain-containing protein [Pelagibacterium sp.]
MASESPHIPTLMPLGDHAILVRFSDRLDVGANALAIDFAQRLKDQPPVGVLEVAPNLVSVLVRYDPARTTFAALAGEIRLIGSETGPNRSGGRTHRIEVVYGGAGGPHLEAVAATLGLTVERFVAAHRAEALRVLSVGFAPGFLYCGMHGPDLLLPRREEVVPSVPPGSVLFAARQTAITATPVSTGWSIIGRTRFLNFDPETMPPTHAIAGDDVTFEVAQ